MTIRRKQRQFKQVDPPDDADGGPITLLVSTDAMDEEGDVVEQSWEFSDQIPFLWSHKSRDFPLGHVTNPRVVDGNRLDVELSEDAERALLVDVDFDADDPRAALIEHKYRRGDLDSSSVGFDPIEMDQFGDDEPGRFHFMSQRLKEVSAVNIAANPDATAISKHMDLDDVPAEIVKALDSEPQAETDTDDSDQTKEGRRNSERDEATMRHAKELMEFLTGDRGIEDVGDCPLAEKMGDHDDKGGGPTTTVKVTAEDVADIVEQKIREVFDEKGQAEIVDDVDASGALVGADDTKGQDDADEPQGGLQIDGDKIIYLTQEKSEEPDSSSGDPSEETKVETVDELFA